MNHWMALNAFPAARPLPQPALSPPALEQLAYRHGVSVLDYGAVLYDPNDGHTYSAASMAANVRAFAAAASATTPSGGLLIVRAQGDYAVNAEVSILSSFDGRSCRLFVMGTPEVALTVGRVDAYTQWASIILPEVLSSKVGNGWAGQGIGVRLVNLYTCQVTVPHVRGFSEGLRCTSFSKGFAYNTLTLGHLNNNQKNMHLIQGNAGAWVNENTFIGGRFSFNSAEGVGTPGTRHILLAPRVGGNGPANNNRFIGLSVEGNTPEFHVECCGPYNHFLDMRWESASAKILFRTADGSDNTVSWGYSTWQLAAIEAEGADRNSVFSSRNDRRSLAQFLKNGSSNAYATLRGYAATKSILSAEQTDTDWCWNLTAQKFSGKKDIDAFARVALDFAAGRLRFGDGAVEPVWSLGQIGGRPGITHAVDSSKTGSIVTTADLATLTVPGAVKQAKAQADAAGTPTQAEFNALLAKLRDAGLMAT